MTLTPTLQRVADAHDRLVAAGEEVTADTLVRESGAGKTSVYAFLVYQRTGGKLEPVIRHRTRHDVTVEVGDLSPSAQHKLEMAIRAHQRRLNLEFDSRVQQEARKVAEELSIPHYLKTLEKVEKAVSVPFGRKIMTRAEFRQIVMCLHPDGILSRTKEQLEDAFRIFNGYRAKLADDEPEKKTVSSLPHTREELLARKKAHR